VASAAQADQFPRLLRGTLITMRRKCGKASCRCADGQQLHEGPALSVSLSGRSVTISLRAADVPAVQAALARYRAGRDSLEEQASAGVQQLRARSARR
jgi:hypothetical protein